MPPVPRKPSRFSLDFDEDEAQSTEFRGEPEEREERPRRGPRPTRTEVLPPPTEISGISGYSEIGGEQASTVQGRSSSPLLFVQAAGHETVSQLKVYKVEAGVPVTLGAIGADATEDDLVRTFRVSMPKPGEGRIKFVIRPIDSENRELGLEATLWMSEDHVAIQRLRAMESAVKAGSPPVGHGFGSVLPPDVMSILGRTMDRSYSSTEAERQYTREFMASLGKERIALAEASSSTVQSFAEKMLQTEAQRAEASRVAAIEQAKQGQESMSAFFGAQLNLAEKAAQQQAERDERDRLREQARMERERQDAEARAKDAQVQAEKLLTREREYAERRLLEAKAEQETRIRESELKIQRERADMELRLKEMEIKLANERQMAQDRQREEREERERRDRAEREERERKERLEREERERRDKAEREEKERKERLEREDAVRREEERKREHEWKLKQLEIEAQQRREHDERMASVQQMQLTAAMQAANQSKTDIKGLLAEASTTLQAFGLDPKELIQKILNPPPPEQDNTAAWANLAGQVMGTVGEVAKAKMTSDALRSQNRRQLPPVAPVQQIGVVNPQQPQRGILPPQPPPQNARPPSSPAQQAQNNAQKSPAQTPPATKPQNQPDPKAGKTPEVITISLEQQKAARKALTLLVKKLSENQESSWQAIIISDLMTEKAIYPYIQAVSLIKAMEEAGASEEMADKIIEGLLDNPMVPEDLNYGVEFEEDDAQPEQTTPAQNS